MNQVPSHLSQQLLALYTLSHWSSKADHLDFGLLVNLKVKGDVTNISKIGLKIVYVTNILKMGLKISDVTNNGQKRSDVTNILTKG